MFALFSALRREKFNSGIDCAVAQIGFSGAYWFPHGVGVGKGTEAGSWDYSFEFEVTVVPIVPTVWLFGSVLLGQIGLARCKRA